MIIVALKKKSSKRQKKWAAKNQKAVVSKKETVQVDLRSIPLSQGIQRGTEAEWKEPEEFIETEKKLRSPYTWEKVGGAALILILIEIIVIIAIILWMLFAG